jgi:hypothetical protein
MLYNLKTEQVDRMNFEEIQQRGAWEAITGYTPAQLADTRNLDGFIAAHDIEEAYATFMSVWRKEFGLASEAAFQPDESGDE